MKSNYSYSYRSVYNLTAHLVFVTKYRKRLINQAMLDELGEVFKSVLEKWEGDLLEFNGERDHVHLLISYSPQKRLSNLVANLKSTSSKTMWKYHESQLLKSYWKERVFWTGAYFAASCGGVTIDELKKYAENQKGV